MRGILLKFKFSEQPQIQSKVQIKKFYKEAKIEMAIGVGNRKNHWLIKLDGKTMKTLQENVFTIPTLQLAQRIADEFNSQQELIKPTTMPLMILARNAVDIDADQRMRAFIEQSIINYLERDTVLFRKQSQTEIYQIQKQKLDPQLTLFNQKYGMHLKVNFGSEVEPLKQYDQMRIKNILKEFNCWQLLSLYLKVENLQSCILALQMWNNQIDIQEAIILSRIEYYFFTNEKFEEHHYFNEDAIIANLKAAKLFAQLIQIQSINY